VRRAGSCLIGLAALIGGCGESAPPEPPIVSVLTTGSEQATGFAVAPGRVVTVAHAVPGEARVRVRAARGEVRSARVRAVHRQTDLALLAVPRLRAAALETATAGKEDRVSVLVLRDGRVEADDAVVRRPIDAQVSAPGAARALSRPALELEARLRAGDSGAPVLTEDGELAGVVFARSRNRADTAYAVDARALRELLDDAQR
jgi:S1-C subfamily serine protease